MQKKTKRIIYTCIIIISISLLCNYIPGLEQRIYDLINIAAILAVVVFISRLLGMVSKDLFKDDESED